MDTNNTCISPKENSCEALPNPQVGTYIPSTCVLDKSPISSICTFQCPSGYKIHGPVQSACEGNGSGTGVWTSFSNEFPSLCYG